MLEYEHHSHGTFDVEEISQFTYEAYSSLPIPYKCARAQPEKLVRFADGQVSTIGQIQ